MRCGLTICPCGLFKDWDCCTVVAMTVQKRLQIWKRLDPAANPSPAGDGFVLVDSKVADPAGAAHAGYVLDAPQVAALDNGRERSVDTVDEIACWRDRVASS